MSRKQQYFAIVFLIMAGISATAQITGSGTTNNVPKFTGSTTVGDSAITESGGNVGIGTTTPGDKLVVDGGITSGKILFRAAFPDAAIKMYRWSGTGSNFYPWYLSTGMGSTSRDFAIQTGGGAQVGSESVSPVLYLQSDGNVGIGTTSPGAKLEVNGNVKFTPGSGASITFADGTTQTTAAGGGAITGVFSGPGLIGGGSGGNVTLQVDGTVARTNISSTFTSHQTFSNAVTVDNEINNQFAFSSTVLSGIAAGFWNKHWADTTWATGSVIAGWAGSNQTQVFHVDTRGTTYTYNGFVAGGFDYAELSRVRHSTEKYEPGDVLVIDETQAVQFTLSTQPRSRQIAGVYSTKPGMIGSSHPMDAKQREDEVPLALIGRVPCKVSTENGPISIGDLLVSSSTPGHAMRADEDARPGTILGKALEPLTHGTDKITILVTLQ